MPLKRRFARKRTTTRRRFGKRRAPKRNFRVKSQRPSVSLGLGFPKKIVMSHKYSDNITLTSTSGAITNYIYSCNGLYDPNITAAGHQPQGFDNLTNLYGYYTVIGSKITCMIAPTLSTVAPMLCALFINNDTTVGAGINPVVAAEQSQARKSNIRLINQAQSDKNAYLVSSWSLKKFHGSGKVDGLSYRGDSGANPTEQDYYIINAQSADASTTTSIRIIVQIQYIAVWTELLSQDAQ